MNSPIGESFDRVCAEHRHRVAVLGLSEHVTRTFAELGDDVVDMRRALVGMGLPERPTIVSHVGNRSGFIPLFVASLSLGAGLLSIDGDAPTREVAEMATVYGADVIVTVTGAGGVEDPSAVPLPCGLTGLVCRRLDGSSWRRPHEIGGFVLKVTSGSTRASKVVIASEQNVLSDAENVIAAMDIQAGDVSLAAVPMAHSYGMGNLLMPLLLRGSRIVLRDTFLPAQWTKDVAEFGVTMFPGVPFIFDYLRRLGDAAAPVSGIRLIVTAGAPIDREILAYFKDRFRATVHSLYGTSETGSITFDSSSDVSDPVSVGWPLPGTTVTLVPMPGLGLSEGRIKVQGAAVAKRYAHEGPEGERSSEFTSEGFLTADLGRFGEDGRLTLLGRVSGFINVAGRKVHPREVERVIAEMPGVLQVTVLGASSGARGQELVACVERRFPTLSRAAIREYCGERLSPYQVPRRIVFTDELPVSSRGKTQREAIEAHLKAAADPAESL
jgi:acyl-CoA synthetase (AMP-forming)/AMP-acid ligase II